MRSWRWCSRLVARHAVNRSTSRRAAAFVPPGHRSIRSAEPLCTTCGDALPTWRVSTATTQRCDRCRRLPRAITIGRAVAACDGRLRDILHALKWCEGRRSVARHLARLMAVAAPPLLKRRRFRGAVPHFVRHYRRGFNQAEELAKYYPCASCAPCAAVEALQRKPICRKLNVTQREKRCRALASPTRREERHDPVGGRRQHDWRDAGRVRASAD